MKTFQEFLKEDFAAPAASPANTPGMGNVSLPSVGQIGSGDIPSGENDDDDEDPSHVLGFSKWLEKEMKKKDGKE